MKKISVLLVAVSVFCCSFLLNFNKNKDGKWSFVSGAFANYSGGDGGEGGEGGGEGGSSGGEGGGKGGSSGGESSGGNNCGSGVVVVTPLGTVVGSCTTDKDSDCYIKICGFTVINHGARND